ncbi:MAG: RluA family pseudouridine synthase, partial [Clostridia bacterium]|nr:RluA family pseudouridine synthase [Clostridia bacterium]
MRILTVGENDSGQRLDRFLTKAVKNMPQSLMYKSVRTKKIKVNRSRAQIGQILKTGDTVQLFLPDDVFGDGNEKNMTEAVLSHTTPVFDVVYEDKNILVVFKPAGLSAHVDETNDTNNLLTQIQAYLYKKGEYSPLAEQSFSPALCHRIDRNTEGLVMAAKNAPALREADR